MIHFSYATESFLLQGRLQDHGYARIAKEPSLRHSHSGTSCPRISGDGAPGRAIDHEPKAPSKGGRWHFVHRYAVA